MIKSVNITYEVQGLTAYGEWRLAGLWDEHGHSMNPVDSISVAREVLNTLRKINEGDGGWKDFNIVRVTLSREVVK